jgi:hypothetical protein
MQVPMTERLARQVGLKRVAVTVFVRGIGVSHVVCVARHAMAKPPVTPTMRSLARHVPPQRLASPCR